MNLNDITIRPAKHQDFEAYVSMMQKTYEAAYTEESIGLTKDCFSKEVFRSKRIQDYFLTMLTNTENKKTWIAYDGSDIVGAITVEDEGDTSELSGFYVDIEFQGKGIGTRLWQKVLDFVGDKTITLDIYTHNRKTIDLYKHWGFTEDTSRARFRMHWPEWPDGVEAECLFMIRRLAR